VCSRDRHSVHWYLPWNGWRLLQLTIITMTHPWFDNLIACAIWQWHVPWKLNVIGHTLYNISELIFNKESHYRQPVHKFHFILYNIHSKFDILLFL
jgi:hypothetical protein